MSTEEHKLDDMINKQGELKSIEDINFQPNMNKPQIGVDGLPTHPVEDLQMEQFEDDNKPEQVSGLEEGESANEFSEENDQKDQNQSNQPQPANRIGRLATIFNLLNSVLGIGLLSVPNSFSDTGFFMSFFILILMAVLCYFASVIVIKLQLKVGAQGLDELTMKILGKVGSIILSILSLLFLVCGLLSYVIVAGDMMTSWFALAGIETETLWRRVLLIGVYAIVFPITMTIPRSVQYLKYFSTATMVCLAFFMVVMIIKCCQYCPDNGIHETCKTFKFTFGMFSTLSTFGLTFSLPVVVLPIIKNYNTLYRKRKIVAFVTTLICVIIVAVTGVTGYCRFGETTKANVLQNFSDDDVLIIIVRVAFFIVVTCAYPLLAQTVFGSWSELIFHVNNASQLMGWRRAVILIIGNGIPILIAMFLSSIKPVIGIAGSLGGCIVNFMYPGLLYVKYSQDPLSNWKNILCILLAVFGLIAGVIATYVAVLSAIDAFK